MNKIVICDQCHNPIGSMETCTVCREHLQIKNKKQNLIGFKFKCHCGRESEFIYEANLKCIGISELPLDSENQSPIEQNESKGS
jgi:hypothetical protein